MRSSERLSPQLKYVTPVTQEGDRPKVWLHIGHGKTGTTALQRYFVARSKADRAVFFPDNGRASSGAHHVLFPLVTQKPALKEVPRLLEDLREQILRRPVHHVTILSSEHMCYFKDWQVQNVKKALQAFDVRILYVVRRQDELITSTFKLKILRNDPVAQSLDRFIKDNFQAFNFLKRIQPWRVVFGDKAICARLYHPETCGRDIIPYALNAMNLEQMPLPAEQRLHRLSLSDQMTRILMAYDTLHDSVENRRLFIKKLQEIEDRFGNLSGKNLITAEQKRDIMRQFSGPNRKFGELFLNPDEAAILSSP